MFKSLKCHVKLKASNNLKLRVKLNLFTFLLSRKYLRKINFSNLTVKMLRSVGYEKFLKERYSKEENLFKVYDIYTANYNKQVVTNKFYSKYEVIDLSKANSSLLANIKKAKESTPRERKPYPETVNQSYGWFSEPLVPFDRKDPRFYFPYRHAPFIKQDIKIKNDVCSKRVVGSTSLKI